MSNTTIKIKRSSSASIPFYGSLVPGEPAYSYVSDTLFIGSSTNGDAVEIGGLRFIQRATQAVSTANLAYNQSNTNSLNIIRVSDTANLAYNTANLAYDAANSISGATVTVTAAFEKANQVGAALTTANGNIDASFEKANQVGEAVTTANNNIISIQGALVTANGNITSAFLKANQVGAAANTINANVSGATSNIANLSGAITTANSNITSAFLKANQVGEAVTTANSNITAAFLKANQVGEAVTTANSNITAAFLKANQVGAAVTTVNTNVSGATSNIANLSGAITTANSNITSAFLKANQVGAAVTTANSYITLAYNQANTAYTIANLAFDKANTGSTSAIDTVARETANSAFLKANQVGEAVTTANNNIANLSGALVTANSNITAAFNKANNALPLTGGTITGDLTIVGNVTLSGNTVFIDATRLQIDDPLIYLAGNNYVSDIVDIGFIGNYVNATGSNVHTGLFRDHETKEYYLFQGYDQEPINNHIDPTGNNLTLSVLNSDIRTSNLILGGINAIPWIISAYNTANLAFNQANAVTGAVTTANGNITAAFLKANQVGEAVTTANINISGATSNIANLSGALTTANSNITAAFLKANQVGEAVTTANSNITAAFLKANTVGIALNDVNGAISFVNTNVSGATSNIANIFGVINTSNGNITAAFLKANQVGEAVTTANNNIANVYFVLNTHNGAFTTANSNILAAFNQANTAYTIANLAFDKANTGGGSAIDSVARDTANAAFLKANQVGEAVTTANSNIILAYNQANTAYTIANLAFDKANTGTGGGGSGTPVVIDEFSFAGDGSTTSFPLSANAYANNILVYVNGVSQPNSTYTFINSNSTVILSEAPVSSDVVFFKLIKGSGTATGGGTSNVSFITSNTSNPSAGVNLTATANGISFTDGNFATAGDAVVNHYILRGTTTSSAEVELLVDGTTSIPIRTNTTMMYTIDAVGRRTDATGYGAAITIKGAADNFSGTTADIGTIYEVIVARDSASYTIDARSNNTTDVLNIYAAGATGNTVRWVAYVTTVEVSQ